MLYPFCEKNAPGPARTNTERKMKKTVSAILVFLAILQSILLVSCARGVKSGGDAHEKGEKLPVVRIEVEGGRKVRDRNYKNVTVTLTGAPSAEYDFSELPAEMKCRGNSTIHMPKLSYRVKFSEKINLMGQGAGPSKSWVLLACHADLTLIRNHVAFTMGRELQNIGFTTSSSFVRLYINGEDKGIYELAEHHGTGKYRVPAEEDPEEPDTDYFVELDDYEKIQENEALCKFEVGNNGFVIKSDTMTPTKYVFIFSWFLDTDKVLASGDREAVEERLDLPSFVDMYILQEFTKNTDAGSSSFFYLKKAGGKLYCTCPWDFDHAFGNDAGVALSPEGLFVGNPDYDMPDGWDVKAHAWMCRLMETRWFVDMVCERWQEVGHTLRDAAIAEIDRLGSLYGDELASNFDMWDPRGDDSVGISAEWEMTDNYAERLEGLKKWIGERCDWLDGYFGDTETRYNTVK